MERVAMKPDYYALIRDGEADALAAIVEARFGYPVPPDDFLEDCRVHCPAPERNPLYLHWSDCTWIMWLKIRAARYRPEGLRRIEPEASTCVLHVGFLSILETEEEISRLHNEHVVPMESRVARSKIGKTNEVISGVDCVAIRVAPMEERNVVST